MTKLERAIVDAIARVKAEGLEPSSVYLRPQDLAELRFPERIGGLPVRRITGKGRPRIYTSRGLARNIAAPSAPRPRKPLRRRRPAALPKPPRKA